MRILDSKDEKDKKINAGAPKMTDYLTASASERFDHVCNALDQKIRYFQYPKPHLWCAALIITQTPFLNSLLKRMSLGAQNTVLAGGRYDGLGGADGWKIYACHWLCSGCGAVCCAEEFKN